MLHCITSLWKNTKSSVCTSKVFCGESQRSTERMEPTVSSSARLMMSTVSEQRRAAWLHMGAELVRTHCISHRYHTDILVIIGLSSVSDRSMTSTHGGLVIQPQAPWTTISVFTKSRRRRQDQDVPSPGRQDQDVPACILCVPSRS